LSAAIEPLHYRNLNEVPELAGKNTTAELVARHIFNKLAPALRMAGVEGLKVTVWESSSSFASYTASVDS
jgi:6-pyruvoyl-tetrahydropterin synthase